MRFIKKFTVMFLFCATLFALTSCFDVTRATGIAVTKMPKSTYYVNEIELKDIDLEITIYYSDNTHATYTYATALGKGVKFTGFDLSTVGNYTATVSFEGLSATFNYSVIASDNVFAGGNGSAISPFLISTPAQFLQLNNVETNNMHFKLINDINLSGVSPITIQTKMGGNVAALGQKNLMVSTGEKFFIEKPFKGYLDGNDHKLYNVYNEVSPANAIFHQLIHATIKNLNVFDVGSTCLAFYVTEGMLLDNVKMYGTNPNGQNNSSVFVGYLGLHSERDPNTANANNDNYALIESVAEYKFKNCESYVDILCTAHKISVFTGFVYASVSLPNPTKIILENCKNYGTLEAQQVGFVGANTLNHAQLTLTNCSNEGNITSMDLGKSVLWANNDPTIDSEHITSGGYQTGNTKRVPWLLNNPSIQSSLNVGKVEVDESENQYVFELNSENDYIVNEVPIHHFKISITVPVKYSNGTDRPHIESQAFGFDDFVDGKLKIGLFKNYDLTNGTIPSGTIGIFNSEWFAIIDGKYVFDASKYIGGLEYQLNSGEKPYFAIYAYAEDGTLLAACTKYKINDTNIPLDSSFGKFPA